MFYFDEFYGVKVLKSDFLETVTAFFTTREGLDFIRLERPVAPVQTHSGNVEIVDGRLEYPETDGLVLKNKKNTVFLRFADCTPLIFYDSRQKIGAVSHAGWRGTAGSIGVKTVRKMNSDPKDITVVIGPAISICCYEVSETVRDSILNTVRDRTGLFEGRMIDLKKINARQLEEIGVSRIDICPYCTSCNNDLFYSYRMEHGTKERHYAILHL